MGPLLLDCLFGELDKVLDVARHDAAVLILFSHLNILR